MPSDSCSWPFPNELGQTETVESEVLVLGGGLSGCFAAIAAARRGRSVVIVEQGATLRSGAGGTGFDHWESACTNPCSKVTPEEIAYAYVDEQDHYSNGISHYIECREGWDRLVDLESFGGKIRDTDDEFAGADFRDEETKLMFAYDYENRFTLRVWGTTFKPALYKELQRLGVRIYDRTEATALLTKTVDGKKRGVGAVGMNVHTGRLVVFKAKSTVLCMSRPARVWLFDSDLTGLCEFRPMQSIGSGHAMGWRAGVEFTMMEKSVKAEFSAAGRSFPPYGTGASFYLRPVMFGTTAGLGVKPSKDALLVVYGSPVGAYFKGGIKPMKVAIDREQDRAAPRGTGDIKAGGNYASSILSGEKAHDLGYANVMYLDAREHKYIEECGAANFFGIKDGKYITPKSPSILPSITNMSLRQLAEDMGLKVEERPVPVDELDTFEEAGACGTAAVISPIESVYDLDTGKLVTYGKQVGKTCLALYNKLQDIQYGRCEDKYGWTTVVEE